MKLYKRASSALFTAWCIIVCSSLSFCDLDNRLKKRRSVEIHPKSLEIHPKREISAYDLKKGRELANSLIQSGWDHMCNSLLKEKQQKEKQTEQASRKANCTPEYQQNLTKNAKEANKTVERKTKQPIDNINDTPKYRDNDLRNIFKIKNHDVNEYIDLGAIEAANQNGDPSADDIKKKLTTLYPGLKVDKIKIKLNIDKCARHTEQVTSCLTSGNYQIEEVVYRKNNDITGSIIPIDNDYIGQVSFKCRQLTPAEKTFQELKQYVQSQKEELECAICLESLADAPNGSTDIYRDVSVMLTCHYTHCFHYSCIVKWYATDPPHPRCPMCRAPFDLKLENTVWLIGIRKKSPDTPLSSHG